MVNQEVKYPKEWNIERVGDKISLEYGQGLIEADRKGGKYPVFGSNGIVGHHNTFLINGPGIIVGRKGTIGAVSWSNTNFWPIDTTYYVNKLDEDISLRWLYYKLISLNLSKLNTATGTPGLNRDLAYSKITAFPTFPEQEKIAEILSTVDLGIEKTEQAIAKTERLKMGLLQKLFTQEVKDKKWELVKLEEIADFINGKAFKPNEWSNNGLPIVRIQNLNDPSKPFNYCSISVPDKNIINDGEILLAWSGTPGTSFGVHRWHNGKAVLNQHIFKVIIKSPSIIKDFFVIAVNYKLGYLIEKAHGGAGLKHVKKDVVNKMQIPLPPIPEQKQVAEILSTMDKGLELLSQKKSKLERIKQGLMNDLLTGKKRVNLTAEAQRTRR